MRLGQQHYSTRGGEGGGGGGGGGVWLRALAPLGAASLLYSWGVTVGGLITIGTLKMAAVVTSALNTIVSELFFCGFSFVFFHFFVFVLF